VVRPAVASGAAVATSGALTAGDGTVTITAKYAGALGNAISFQWTAATSGDADERNLVVTTTGGYAATYEDLTTATVTAVDDPFIDVAAAGATALPTAGAATALTSGADGAAAAADFTGTGKGIALFEADAVSWDVLFVAECPSALVDDVNTKLDAVSELGKGFVVLCTVASQAASAAITYIADYRSSRGGSLYCWPRVKTTDFFQATPAEVTVDGNAFAAAAIANVDPWLSPGGAGKNQGGVDLLAGITGLEDESATRASLDALNAAGVAPFARTAGLGIILRRAVTTALSGRTRVYSRRMADYLIQAITSFAELFVERPLDVDLANNDLGTWTGGFVTAVRGFLDGEAQAEHLRAYSVDPFSASTPTDIAANRWTVLISVQLLSMNEELVLKTSIGETVQIAEA
jgi:hypothetical protein